MRTAVIQHLFAVRTAVIQQFSARTPKTGTKKLKTLSCAIDPVLLGPDPLRQATIQEERVALSDRPMVISLRTFRKYVNVLYYIYERHANGGSLDAMEFHRFPQLAAFLAPVITRSQQLETLRREHEEENAQRKIHRHMRSQSFR